MYTPFDWQESIGNRAEYAEARLKQGAPVLGISLAAGVLLFTYQRQAPKLFEIYDALAMGAIGQQADVESVRVAAVEFASREGYQRSEADVTIQRVITTISNPIKSAFADFRSAPFVLRALFAEVGHTPETDSYYVVNYDGDFNLYRNLAIATGYSEEPGTLEVELKKISPKTTPEKAIPKLTEAWMKHAKDNDIEESSLEGLAWQALLIERTTSKENRITVLKQS